MKFLTFGTSLHRFCLPVDKCQYWLDLENGKLTSPKHPINYGNNESCSWTISATDSNIIILDFHNFDVNIYFIYMLGDLLFFKKWI